MGNGVEEEVEECNTQRCCFLLDWTDWSPCSVTCKTGVQTRTRSYDEECTAMLGAPAVVEIDEMVCKKLVQYKHL